MGFLQTFKIDSSKKRDYQLQDLTHNYNHAHNYFKCKTKEFIEKCSHLRICLKHYVVDVGDQTGEDKTDEEDCHPWCLCLVSLGTTVEAEVLEGDESEDADLL